MKRSDLIPPFLLSPYLFILDSANKKYVDENSVFKKVKVVDNQALNFNGGAVLNFSYPTGFTDDDFINLKFVLLEFHNITTRNLSFGYEYAYSTPIIRSDSSRSYNNFQSLKSMEYLDYSSSGIQFYSGSGNTIAPAVEIRSTGEKYIKISSNGQTTGTASAYFIT